MTNQDNFPHNLTIEELNELNPYDWVNDLLIHEVTANNIDRLLHDITTADTPPDRAMAIHNLVVRCQELRPTN
jgi:hypothetical protein